MSGAGEMISGMLAVGYAVAALFFLRFWRQARDRLFLFFSVAFWLLAVQRVLLTIWAHNAASFTLLYGLRAFAFLVIIVAVADKNRARDA